MRWQIVLGGDLHAEIEMGDGQFHVRMPREGVTIHQSVAGGLVVRSQNGRDVEVRMLPEVMKMNGRMKKRKEEEEEYEYRNGESVEIAV
jgi:hypothetical protein